MACQINQQQTFIKICDCNTIPGVEHPLDESCLFEYFVGFPRQLEFLDYLRGLVHFKDHPRGGYPEVGLLDFVGHALDGQEAGALRDDGAPDVGVAVLVLGRVLDHPVNANQVWSLTKYFYVGCVL